MAQDRSTGGLRPKVPHIPAITKNDPRRKLLPEPRPRAKVNSSSVSAASPLRARRRLRTLFHATIYSILQVFYLVLVRIRRAYHSVSYTVSTALFYHHRSPEYIERDTAGLGKRPHHLSVVLKLADEARLGPELERLVDEAADLAAWSASAGIPVLSVYEKTGVLKKYLPQVHQHILQKLTTYFGPNHPGLTVTAPDQDSIETPGPNEHDCKPKGQASSRIQNYPPTVSDEPTRFVSHLRVIFISSRDGRDALVDLTRTFAEMRQHNKLRPEQILPEVIDTELVEGIFPEPDLLVLFTPQICLDGYPPWQLRGTEIYRLQDNHSVGYQVFLRALRNYSRAEIRLGR